MYIRQSRLDHGTSTSDRYTVEVTATDEEWAIVEEALAQFNAPQWRPIPDEPPSDGWYWFLHQKGMTTPKIIQVMTFDGQVFVMNIGDEDAQLWSESRVIFMVWPYALIAGPITPPDTSCPKDDNE